MQNLPADVIQSIRESRPVTDNKLESLRKFVQSATEKRGNVSESEKTAFLEAGYTKQNILEVLLVIGMKTLSNYTNHIAETPLDTAFEPAKWQKAAA
jgi:alkylhydroperoxidase family enzyme